MTSHIKTIFAALALTTAYASVPAYAQSDATETEDLAGAAKQDHSATDGNAHDHSGHDHAAHATAAPTAMPDIDHVFTEAPDDHIIGSAAAPVTMIVYASVTCPHCGQWFTSEWPKFKAEQIDTGNVRFIMREYPTQPQMIARAGFAIINCAPEEEYFTHLVKQMQSQETVFEALRDNKVRPVYEAFAREAGLATPQAMNQCLNDKNIQAQIDRAIIRANTGGIKGVPAFVMNGELVDGDLSAKGLSAMIEQTLSGGVSAPERPLDAVTPYESKPD